MLGACGSSTPTGPSEGAVTFSGVVREYATERAVVGALVRFVPEAQNPSEPGPEATTAADGRYSVTVPRAGTYSVVADGLPVGLARVGGSTYRGDLLTRNGTCIARYGTINESQTLRPIAGATVALTGGRAVTDGAGWYRIDLGCPDVVLPGGTTVMTVTHPSYQDRVQVVGRGVADVVRLDVDMTRR
jgi:hypothetical protein